MALYGLLMFSAASLQNQAQQTVERIGSHVSYARVTPSDAKFKKV
jgi:hypothetical protein